jgi:3-hydroxyisobutyrate dehydrogenase-like beta-hydroxyacid dehydrogenase
MNEERSVEDMTKKQSIGWIGLGKMGTPMAKNIAKAGCSLIVYNRTNIKTGELADEGAKVVDSPKELASGSDVVISMISDDLALEAVSIGPNGAFEGAKAGTIYIDMSTVSPAASARIGETASKKGIKYLRAPVMGSIPKAENGSLGILVSGSKDVYEDCRDILETMGDTFYYLGTGEESRIMKLVLNMQIGIISAMTAEALTFGEAGGMDWGQMIGIVRNSSLATPMTGFKADALTAREFPGLFTATQMAKDLDIVIDAGRDMNTALPITSVVRQLLGIMKARGKGENDFWELLTLLEEFAGLKD